MKNNNIKEDETSNLSKTDFLVLVFILFSLAFSILSPNILSGDSIYNVTINKVVSLYNEDHYPKIKTKDVSDIVINHQGFIEMTVGHHLILSEKPIVGHSKYITEFVLSDFNDTTLREVFKKE